MKRGMQWNILILSAGLSSPRNLHQSVTCLPKFLGTPTLLILASPDSFGQQPAVHWLQFPQETGIHVENKASHRDILLQSGQERL